LVEIFLERKIEETAIEQAIIKSSSRELLPETITITVP